MCRDTLVHALARAAASPDGVRFVDRVEREQYLSYETLRQRAREVAGGLQRLGLEPGDRVAVVLQTSPEFYDAFFGVLVAGAIPVPLYPPVRLGRLEEYHTMSALMLRTCGARLVLTSSRIRRLLGRTIARAKPPLGCVAIERLARSKVSRVRVMPDDPALIQFSSGTTVDPKPVLLTHRQILANVDAMRERILSDFPEGSGLTHAGVSWLPLYHDMGLIGGVLQALRWPATLTLIPPEDFLVRPALWLRAISRHRATITGAPNFAFGLCLKRIKDQELEGVDLSSLRLALNGAEPITPDLLRQFNDRFRLFGLREEAITPVYGLSEASVAVTYSDPDRLFRVTRFDEPTLLEQGVAQPRPDGYPLVSVGTPLAGHALRVVSDQGQPLPSGHLGRVQTRGPSIMQGYFERPEATAVALRNGWLDTGDTGFLHEGELFLYGRAKDLIILRGRNYAPQGIEHVLNSVRGVRVGCSAAVGHLPRDGGGEVLLVFVERDGSRPAANTARLAERASRRITQATGLVPYRVVVLEPGTLPRTSSGKIRRGEALRRYLDGSLNPPSKVSAIRIGAEALRSSLAFARTPSAGYSPIRIRE